MFGFGHDLATVIHDALRIAIVVMRRFYLVFDHLFQFLYLKTTVRPT